MFSYLILLKQVMHEIHLHSSDVIDIDMDQYTIQARVSEEEFARRREKQVMPESWVKGGWLARYQKLVSSADEGAILRD